MASKKNVQKKQIKNTKPKKKIERKVSKSPSKARKRAVSKSARKSSIRRKKDEKNTFFSLIGCMVVLLGVTFLVIGMFDKKGNVFDALFSNNITENVLAYSDKKLYMVNDDDKINLSAKDIVNAHLAEKINAKQNNYKWDRLYTNGSYRYYLENDKIVSTVGIDVSYHQKDIDWKKVKKSGVQFAIIRIGYRSYEKSGRIIKDERFEEYIKGALDAGIDVGVYFFTQAINVEEAKEEAKFVLDGIKKYKITYPVVIDTEPVGGEKARSHKAELSKKQLTDICIAFCDEIDKAGYHSAIYASSSWFISKLNLESLEKYDKWLAHYTKGKTTFPFEFAMWQYTEDGKVDGIDAHDVDLNISFVDYTKKPTKK